MKKNQEKETILMGKIPQKRNKSSLNPKSNLYDQDLAKRRKKEKARRKANQLNRRRGG